MKMGFPAICRCRPTCWLVSIPRPGKIPGNWGSVPITENISGRGGPLKRWLQKVAEPPDRTGFEQGVDVHHVLQRRLGSDFAMGWHVFYGKYTEKN